MIMDKVTGTSQEETPLQEKLGMHAPVAAAGYQSAVSTILWLPPFAGCSIGGCVGSYRPAGDGFSLSLTVLILPANSVRDHPAVQGATSEQVTRAGINRNPSGKPSRIPCGVFV
jgi:hypothetical protein